MADREKVIRELKAARLFFEMGSNRADGVVGNLGCKSGMKYIDDALTLLKEQNQDEKRFTANEACIALICHGQSDGRFEWGEVIKYSPSEVEKILKGEM